MREDQEFKARQMRKEGEGRRETEGTEFVPYQVTTIVRQRQEPQVFIFYSFIFLKIS